MGDNEKPEKEEEVAPTPPEKKVYSKEDAKMYPYPTSVAFIVSTEFCERFSFYGMKTVLALFFKEVLDMDNDVSTVLYHAFTALCYFTPIFGAILADSFVGKFRTIFYISIIYAIGQIVLTIGAIGNTEGHNEGIAGLPADALSYIGLLLIAIGTGGIKPCVASFGGDQFKQPEQSYYMETFFSIFYAAINAGSLISTVLTPSLRQNVQCFNQTSCYPLAFGVPAGLMVVAIVIFSMGKVFNLYKIQNPDTNIIVKTTQCIMHSFGEKRKRHAKEELPSVLDYGEKKYGKSFIDDIKALKNVVYMFLPFPIFWALFDQQGSRWIFQATRMNGDTFGYVILPDQMQVSNPVLILGFIPFFDYVVYPILTKFKLLTTPLQRIVAGGILAMLAFVVSGVLEISLEKTYPDLPASGKMHFSLYNGIAGCDLGNFAMEHKDLDHPIMVNMSNIVTELHDVPQGQWTVRGKSVTCGSNVYDFPDVTFTGPPQTTLAEVDEGDNAQQILFTRHLNPRLATNKGIILPSMEKERLEKSDTGLPYVKVSWTVAYIHNASILLQPIGGGDSSEYKLNVQQGDHFAEPLVNVGKHRIILTVDGVEVFEHELPDEFKVGGNYQIVIQYDNEAVDLEKLIVQIVTAENTIHIFWLLPQFVIMTAGEIMFSITSLQFSYTQAPNSMKAVMMSVRFLTNAVGNIIDVVIISLLKDVFTSQAHFFFLFAGIMLLDMILLGWMATSYTYVDYTKKENPVATKQPVLENEEGGKANPAFDQ